MPCWPWDLDFPRARLWDARSKLLCTMIPSPLSQHSSSESLAFQLGFLLPLLIVPNPSARIAFYYAILSGQISLYYYFFFFSFSFFVHYSLLFSRWFPLSCYLGKKQQSPDTRCKDVGDSRERKWHWRSPIQMMDGWIHGWILDDLSHNIRSLQR